MEEPEEFCADCGCRLYDGEVEVCTFCATQRAEDTYFDEKMELQKEKENEKTEN